MPVGPTAVAQNVSTRSAGIEACSRNWSDMYRWTAGVARTDTKCTMLHSLYELERVKQVPVKSSRHLPVDLSQLFD